MSEKKESWKNEAIAWFQSLRFSMLTVILLGITASAAFILTPSISIYVQQQREIQALEKSVELHRQALSESEAEKLKWEDPVFIRAQARERLYYVMPGEKQLSVITEGVVIPDAEPKTYSDQLTKETSSWPRELAKSFVRAGITTAAPEDFK